MLIKQHVASHTSTILIQHNLNLNGLFPADIILEINKTSLLSKSGECGKGEGRGEDLHILPSIPLQITLTSGWKGQGQQNKAQKCKIYQITASESQTHILATVKSLTF